MKYDQKDFKIKTNDEEFAFTLSGKAPETLEVEELFDGNETMKGNDKLSTRKYGKSRIGSIKLNKGLQTIQFKSGKEFDFKTTIEEFHKQDRKYRGLNIDSRIIKFVKQ